MGSRLNVCMVNVTTKNQKPHLATWEMGSGYSVHGIPSRLRKRGGVRVERAQNLSAKTPRVISCFSLHPSHIAHVTSMDWVRRELYFELFWGVTLFLYHKRTPKQSLAPTDCGVPRVGCDVSWSWSYGRFPSSVVSYLGSYFQCS